MRGTAGEVRTNALATFSDGTLHMDGQEFDGKLDLFYNSSLRTQDVV